MPMETVKAKRLIPSVILATGNTSPASVMVAEPQTEYTAPIYSRMTIRMPNTGNRMNAGKERQNRARNNRYT